MKKTPTDAIVIFTAYAGNNYERWNELLGVAIVHTSLGKGVIHSIDQNSTTKYIYINIVFDSGQRRFNAKTLLEPRFISELLLPIRAIRKYATIKATESTVRNWKEYSTCKYCHKNVRSADVALHERECSQRYIITYQEAILRSTSEDEDDDDDEERHLISNSNHLSVTDCPGCGKKVLLLNNNRNTTYYDMNNKLVPTTIHTCKKAQPKNDAMFRAVPGGAPGSGKKS